MTPAEATQAVRQAIEEKRLVPSAFENIEAWLTEDRYSDYRDQVVALIADERWQELDDAFWTIIPFGTGGRRGQMYPVGSNMINDRTIGESAQGLADYVIEYNQGKESLSCAIAYDTRHRSRHFAELCAGIMAAAGIKVYFLDDYRATPQLSFAVRHKGCDCGIMVTASHNPPSDNAVKVYWSSGAQVLPPHDKNIIDRVMNCQQIRSMPFAEAQEKGLVEFITAEIDEAFLAAAGPQGFAGPKDVKVLYTPLHGVGAEAVMPMLKQDGFNDVKVYGPHEEKSGDFPNVPGHVSNPENKHIFEQPISEAQAQGYDLILATDPDCDRLGVAAPVTADTSGPWTTFTGNQIAALLTDYVLRKRAEAGTLSPEHYVIKTLVTTNLVRSISEEHSVRCVGDLLVGFKFIAKAMDENGPDLFVFGCEESHGYLVGQYCRDKDGAVACMLLTELAAELKSKGVSLAQHLESLYHKHGYHKEHLLNLFMKGSEGMAAMTRLMSAFRESPPSELAGLKVAQVRDYLNNVSTDTASGQTSPLAGPTGNLIILDLAETGNYVAVRPSGTEPKIKLYMFTKLDQAASQDLDQAEQVLSARLEGLESDMEAFAAANQ
ncbi:MAG: phosphomannomutase [Rhodopirellula sp. TMED11]|nr:MAG: phosphomannomutase [Rhodopirellula sp. TMED11]